MEIIKEKLRKNGRIVLQEYVCGGCGRPFWMERDFPVVVCPFCEERAYLNGDIELARETNGIKKTHKKGKV